MAAKHVLDPSDRIAEVLFGLIMVLTFTGSLSMTEAGREDVHAMLIGALGCNLAWGVIDGVFYLMGCVAERGRDRATYRAVQQAATPLEARRLIADALPPVLASAIGPLIFAQSAALTGSYTPVLWTLAPCVLLLGAK